MAYSDFTLAKVRSSFNLTIKETTELFDNLTSVEPSNRLIETLTEGVPLATAIATEKGKSEFIIAPILLEVKRRSTSPVSIFSGTNFIVSPTKGLMGYCDFILSSSEQQYILTKPVVTIVEAKKDDISAGLGQCAAEMFAAQLFNSNDQTDCSPIYGVVTTGTVWKFLKLFDSTLYIDVSEYYIDRLDLLLAILLTTVAIIPKSTLN